MLVFVSLDFLPLGEQAGAEKTIVLSDY